ncbi:MAG: hypothetical protein Q7J32_02655 [Sphingomonadaceae bacterium]|nr:hypothetical protein [Sphingomonadaceae bacterium]
MAYLDLTDPQRWAAVRSTTVPGFDKLDEAALTVAAHDGLWSLNNRSRLTRFLGQFLGLRLATPLADSRLEALRRLGVAARLGTRRIVEREIERARSRGFTPFQIEAVLGRFGLAPAEFQRN